MFDSRSPFLWVGLIILVCLTQPTLAFGAGNIGKLSSVEGVNWRHGDIEDILLTIAMARSMKGEKFSKSMVERIYFGNWLRDYSQAVDVGTVGTVSAEAVRLVIFILSFMTFGYGSKEFEVTADRLGCYRPEEHIDNPKDYAENQDARKYDRRLRGPVDEERELSVDPATGMKNYIANEQARITTSAGLLRKLFGQAIELGRRHARTKDNKDLYEVLRLLGTGLHCLEDFFAHSNYIELALIEMGERDVLPHVGRDTEIRLEGARGRVYPITTGTFGGVDFLHSVTGEVTDKLKQNEFQELEQTLENSGKEDTSMLRDLLDKIPDSFFGGKHQSDKLDEIQQHSAQAQMQAMTVSPREPEEFTKYCQNLFKEIMPIIEWHDDLMRTISELITKIPILPKIIEQLEEQLNKFIQMQLAPFILPVLKQIQSEMQTGSETIIQSSQREQHIVFDDDRSSNPTHSMLSKDHFTNLLNEPAGRTASKMVEWVVPQLMNAIDDDNVDVDRTLTRIIYGVFHHPAQREQGRDGIQEGRQVIFRSIESWWNDMGREQQDDYRRKLSRQGVQNGENHKEGEYDTGHGHGCLGHLKMDNKHKNNEPKNWEDKIADHAATAIWEGATGVISGALGQGQSKKDDGPGGLLGAASSLLGGVFGNDEKKSSNTSHHGEDGSHTQTHSEYGKSGNKYAQAQYSETQYSGGGGNSEYRRYEQDVHQGGRQSSGYGVEERTETRPTHGGGYEQHTERHEYQSSSGGYGGRHEESSGGGHNSSYYGGDNQSGGHQQGGYGGREEHSSGYGGRQEESHGRREEHSGGYGGRQEESYGRREDHSSGYGGRQEESYGQREEHSGGYGGHQQGYGRHEESSGGYGGRQEGGYGGGESAGYYGGGDSNQGYGQHEGRRGDRDDSREDHGRRRRDDDNEYGGDHGQQRYY